jgi:hypothetical protein
MKTQTTKAAHRGAVTELVNALTAQTGAADVWHQRGSGVIVWRRSPETSSRAVELRCYNEVAFRLGSLRLGHRIPRKFLDFGPCYSFELSFAIEEVSEVAKGFVTFVESAFEHPELGDEEAIWRWPLFAHADSYPHYAWSKKGWRIQDAFALKRHGVKSWAELEARKRKQLAAN